MISAVPSSLWHFLCMIDHLVVLASQIGTWLLIESDNLRHNKNDKGMIILFFFFECA